MSRGFKGIKLEIEVLGDKSISHRALMIASISKGITKIYNFLFSNDSVATMDCLKKLGVKIEVEDKKVIVYGNGLYSFKFYDGVLDAKNSGTTIRLLSGILCGNKFNSILDGDSSLRKRPMDRIIKPLSLMGANIKAHSCGKFSPIYIEGRDLKSISYNMEVNSAQVKSSILFGGLYGEGITKVYEKVRTRNHTENMLKHFNANIKISENEISIEKSQLNSNDILIPGDISSASFFIALFGCLNGCELIIKNVGINETRTGFIDVLTEMGIVTEFLNVRENNFEKICDIKVYGSKYLKPVKISGDIIPRLIDEIPIICVLCSFAQGESLIEDVEELRYKESDRIKSIVKEFKKLNINIHETQKGIKIIGGNKIISSQVDSHNDHRIAMALSILSCISGEYIPIKNKGCVDISFPNFYEKLNNIMKMLR